ncbi:unnamed protein product, partial [Mesorhabditis spiculigera]
MLVVKILLFCIATVYANPRLCEVDGSCRACGDGRYSFYRCQHQGDCFQGETCDGEFCCPMNRQQMSGVQNESDLNEPCPDGSTWMRRCNRDSQCNAENELCAEGKCCVVCWVRRRTVLDEMEPSTELFGAHIPQCDAAEIRLYRPRQCLAGTDTCWCANPFGRKVEQPNASPCPVYGCQPGCQCLPGFVRATSSPISQCVPYTLCSPVGLPAQPQCKDPNREYNKCGSSCPISCETRLTPPCGRGCVEGCFCRVPYILEKKDDPLNSRCILPAECPLISQPTTTTQLPPLLITPPVQQPFSGFGRTLPTISVPPLQQSTLPPLPPYPSIGAFPPLPSPPTTTASPFPSLFPTAPTVRQCEDPQKQWMTCGSACPVGCDSSPFSGNCGQGCVAGCFCTPPFILLSTANPMSSCVLPPQCPQGSQDSVNTSTAQPKQPTCGDPRKVYSECGAERCARSCWNPSGVCMPGTCFSGCICREPYVLADPGNTNSRCVLPNECDSSCQDSRKEFINCGSACPLGCDNRDPRHCTPCEKGCYCRNGFVFRNSTDWRNSDCITLEECPVTPPARGTAFISESSTPASSAPISLEPPKADSTTPFPIPMSSQCPATTLDIGGKACILDSECPNGQFCCRARIEALNASPQRCTCADSNAVWTGCGSLCPEYCGQPNKPVCSSTCNPSCQCAPGYIRIRNELNAACVKREECPASSQNQDGDLGPMATLRDITPDTTEKGFTTFFRDVATAHLVSPHSFVSGKFTFERIADSVTRIRGSMDQLPAGSHAVVMHQFGDVTDSCARLGPVFLGSRPQVSGILGDVVGGQGNTAEFVRLVDWPVQEVVGRGIAVYLPGTKEWTMRSGDIRPLACATIGVTRR